MCMLMAYQIDCVAQPNHQGDEPTLDVEWVNLIVSISVFLIKVTHYDVFF